MPNCKKVDAIARNAVEGMNIQADIVKVTDYSRIMENNILSTPGLVINEKVVSSGRIPSTQEVTTWLEEALTPAA